VAAVAALTPAVVPRYDSPKHHRPSHCVTNVRILLDQARRTLLDAEYAARPLDRYAQADRAALRAAAAVLAARARPRNRARPTSAWALLATLGPDFAEWSRLFAATSATRAAAEAGARHLVTERDADNLVRRAGEFLTFAAHAVARSSR